jgi:hypothetical protein
VGVGRGELGIGSWELGERGAERRGETIINRTAGTIFPVLDLSNSSKI